MYTQHVWVNLYANPCIIKEARLRVQSLPPRNPVLFGPVLYGLKLPATPYRELCAIRQVLFPHNLDYSKMFEIADVELGRGSSPHSEASAVRLQLMYRIPAPGFGTEHKLRTQLWGSLFILDSCRSFRGFPSAMSQRRVALWVSTSNE